MSQRALYVKRLIIDERLARDRAGNAMNELGEVGLFCDLIELLGLKLEEQSLGLIQVSA